ncbi:DNA (cytosine-5)-methyltransferase 1 [Roseovarius nanhaiticus]|uniref:Cytosine-specific methyltransferase n=1 Tax=Roseovarius nanhaiticus TaxID=573024 RepID=A0A1N7HIY7_9RHOB|nr:DNA (cytosine-5-)-methyltransferase [Roseovarius nanhaiticus]SEK92252.1 DNA (cytosine-5)-methyltransferase 1 [Roseovarius nanhaiticus]SIS24638.1 DNA (cytosine-5)-methyltransferase 1 [Roseovarius nanhaiticus]
MSKELKVISLYTGVGGLDFGFEAAGFVTRVACEIDKVACRTMRLNRPEWPVLEGDIHNFSSEQILTAAQLLPEEADVLIGGPPCQPFSKSSYWFNGDTRRLDDPRASTLDAFLRVLRDTKPKAFLLENVYGLVYRDKDEGLKHLLSGIDAINTKAGTNYKVHWKMVNSARYGVPQARERVFLIASRDGRDFQFPAETHASVDEIAPLDDREPFRTAWDAIGDLPKNSNETSIAVGGKWGDLLPSIPEGHNYLWHTNRRGGQNLFGWRTRYWSFLLKLAKDQPSWTIQAQPGSAVGPFHWNNRKLTTQEMCRIQTFPDGLVFDCGRTDVQKMLGNAVPSLVAEVLARSIRSQILDDAPEGSLRLLPPKRLPVPEPEPVDKVPGKYMYMVGEHKDHPGTKRQKERQRKTSPKLTLSEP